MKMKERMRSVLIVLILTVTMIAPGFSSEDYVWADDGSDVHYIAVGADRHDTPTAIANAMGGMPETVEYVCLNGDMTDFDRSKTKTLTADQTEGDDSDSKLTDEEFDAKYDGLLGAGGSSSKQKAYNTSTVLKEVTDVFPQLNNTNVSIVYGSHDANATDDAGIMKCAVGVPTSDGADHDDVTKGQSGPIFAGENYSYLVYGVSYYDMMDADDGKAYAKEFEEWADQQDSMIPLIVICHVPIHKLRKDNKAATYWNKALNYAATGSETPEEGAEIIRNVVFLHGHNHTSESTEYFIQPGGSMQAEGDDAAGTIYYSYITSGYLKTGHTATLIGIDNNEIKYTKYTGSEDWDGVSASTPTELGKVTRVADPDAIAAEIAALPENLSSADRAAVIKARNDYNRLSEAEANALPSGTLEKLVLAEARLDAAMSKEEKAEVIDLAKQLLDAYEVDTALYKDATVSVFNEAVEAASALLDGDPSLAKLKKANDDLKAAKEGLVLKEENTLTVKAKTPSVKYTNVRKKARVVTRANAMAVTNAKGTVTYAKKSGSVKLTINKTTGNITVKKGTKKGTYKITVIVTAAGDGDYNSASKTVTIKVKVK